MGRRIGRARLQGGSSEGDEDEGEPAERAGRALSDHGAEHSTACAARHAGAAHPNGR
jgi:hypothetical protein